MNVHLIRRLKFHNYVFRDRKKWQQNHKEKKGLKTLCPQKGFLALSRGFSSNQKEPLFTVSDLQPKIKLS